MIKGATLPDDVCRPEGHPAVHRRAARAPALEFLSPIKGPSLEQITVAVGSGLEHRRGGRRLYDQDVEKQAQQLGLPGW